MPKKKVVKKKVVKKKSVKKAVKEAAKKRDTYSLTARYIGSKQFPTGALIYVSCVGAKPKSVECVGPNAKGKTVAKYVPCEELADLRITWCYSWGRKLSQRQLELGAILQRQDKVAARGAK